MMWMAGLSTETIADCDSPGTSFWRADDGWHSREDTGSMINKINMLVTIFLKLGDLNINIFRF